MSIHANYKTQNTMIAAEERFCRMEVGRRTAYQCFCGRHTTGCIAILYHILHVTTYNNFIMCYLCFKEACRQIDCVQLRSSIN